MKKKYGDRVRYKVGKRREAHIHVVTMRAESINLYLLFFFFSITCLAALQRHGECLALVNKRLETDHHNPDLYIMRARLHEMFRNVSRGTFKMLKKVTFVCLTKHDFCLKIDCMIFSQICR